MGKLNFYNRGQSLIGIVIVLVIVGLLTGGLYLYFSQQLPEIPEVSKRPAGEEAVQPEEGVPPSEEARKGITKEGQETIEPQGESSAKEEAPWEEELREIPKISGTAPSLSEFSFKRNVDSDPRVNSNSVFMIGTTDNYGDVDWQSVLTISTIAKISPVLIIENKDSIDDFSSKLFIEQYSPSKIYLHNYTYSFSNTEKINTDNINSQLYSSANFVIIADKNDYIRSLTAASFAAHFNIPIFFSPLNSSEQNLIKKWWAKKIGVNIKENVDYSLTVSEAENIMKRDSDYLILTTSDDLYKSQRPRFSLAAPILAGGRKGIVLNIKNTTRTSVKSEVSEITRDGFNPSYIIVVGSEKNFPFLEYDIVPPGTFYGQVDDHKYFVNLYYWANYRSSSEYIPDAATGAMTGYSVSDVSSLIARSIFYDRIAKSNKVVYWAPYEEPVSGLSTINPILDIDFSKKYINNFKNYDSLDSKSAVVSELKNSSVLIYSGHAWRTVLGNLSVAEIPTLNNPTFIFAFGCGVLRPWNPGSSQDIRNDPVIPYEAIRKGAIGILGAAEVWFVSGEDNYGYTQRAIVETALNMPVGDSVFLT